eukprot:112264-Pyramimonas_sp.AAC.1
MCAASHSCHAFRIVDGKKNDVEKKNGHFVLIFCSPNGRSRIGSLSAGIRRKWGYILLRNKDEGEGGEGEGEGEGGEGGEADEG